LYIRACCAWSDCHALAATGKLYRFRAAHLWRLDEGTKEYSKSLKYLSFDSHAGDEALKYDSPLVAHIVARDELRRELWAAVAIAQLLGRVLVLPRHNCYCDRYWYPILPQCRLPGSQPYETSQPCPLDQILDVGAFVAPGFPVETRVDGFLEHPSAAPLLASRKEVTSSGDGSSLVKCLSPSEVVASLASSESVLQFKGGIKGKGEGDSSLSAMLAAPTYSLICLRFGLPPSSKGLFCGYGDRKAASLDAAIATVFKQSDWCCHQNGSMPLAPHARTEASPPGTIGAGPREDSASIGRAKEVWALTNPENDKWWGGCAAVECS
jgi:hypothetical protein